jgi:hypothetical protein
MKGEREEGSGIGPICLRKYLEKIEEERERI